MIGPLAALRMVVMMDLPPNRQYKRHQIPNFKCFLAHLAVAFVQYIGDRYWVGNEDVVGAAPTGDGDAPTTSEWSTILLPNNVRFILDVLR